MTSFKKYFVLLLVILCQANLTSQGSLTINLAPVGEITSAVESVTDNILIQVSNNPRVEQNVFFVVNITGRLADGTSLRIDNNINASDHIVNIPASGFAFTLTNLIEQYQNSTLEDYNIVPASLISQIESTRRLPAGDYNICLEARSLVTNQVVSTPGLNNCLTFNITQRNPPIIQSPEDNTWIPYSDLNEIRIQWAHDIPNPTTTFNVEIIRFPSSEAANDFMTQGSPQHLFETYERILLDENIRDWSYNTLNADVMPNLEAGDILAVRVTAVSESSLFINNGRSNIVVFIYGIAQGALCNNPTITADWSFPSVGDTLPFPEIFPVARFQPTCDNFLEMRGQINFARSYNGAFVGSTTVRDYYDDWRSGPGPANYLRNYFQNNFPRQVDFFYPVRSEYEQYLPFLHDDRNFIASRGEQVNIFGYLSFTKSVIPNNTIMTQALSLNSMNTNGIIIGMPKPVLRQPENDAELRSGSTVNFEFKTGVEPSNPLPPFKIFKLEGRSTPVVPSLMVFEKCILQVATSPTFNPSEIVFCQLKKIQSNPYNNADNFSIDNPVLESRSSAFDLTAQRQFDQDHYISQVYRDLNISTSFDQEDTLYWRVVWLRDPAAVNVTSPCGSGITINESDIYHKSETRRLIISDVIVSSSSESDGGDPVVWCQNFFNGDDSPPTSSNLDCERICNQPEIPESQRVPVSGIAVGEDITIGNYIFKVSTISGSGTTYSGTGILNLNSRIRLNVSFSNARINEARIMFDGIVTANSENRSDLPRTNSTEMAGIVDGIAELTRLGEALSGTATNLPFGIDYSADNELRIVAALDKATFRPTGARASYLVGVKLPEEMDGASILFAADDLCLNPNGLAGAGKYMLAADLNISLDNGWELGVSGSRDTLTATYIEFDCDGFKALAFRGKIVFSRDAIVPENVTSGEVTDGQVSAIFGTKIDRNAKFLLGLTFDKPFQFTDLPHVGFTVNSAILDFSESENYPGMRFPALYDLSRLPVPAPSSPSTGGTSAEARLRNSWTGFYLRELSMRLPKDLAKPRPGIGIGDVLIDPSGVSFEVRATGVWEIPQESDHGYSLSLDTLALGLVQSHIGYGRISGGIGLPIFEDGDLLNYSAILAIGGTSPSAGEERPAERTEEASVSPNINFIFTVRPDVTGLSIPMWDIARIRLEPTTNVNLSIGSNFEFSFSLTGAVTFLSSNNDSRASNMSINFPSIRVENLAFSTARSGIRGRISLVESGRTTQLWAQSSPQKDVSGFPINLDGINIALVSGSLTRYDLRFDLTINFGDKIAGSADLGFRFNLGREGSPDFSKFTFEEFLAPTSIEITAEDLGGLDLYGRISFCNSGLSERFIGELRVGIPSVGQINLYADFGTQRNNATAGFNSPDYFSFFAIEGSVVLSTGITLFPGVALYGIGGGVFYHMRRTAPLPTLTAPPVSETAGTSVSSSARSTLPPATPIGCAGAPFEPHFATFLGFGFKAYLGDNGGGSAYNFDVGIEAAIAGNPDGSVRGLQRVVFDGNLYVSCGIGRGNNTAPLRARVNIAWTKGVDGDDNYEGIHGIIEVYLNLYSVVTGAGTLNKMVDAVFHADNRDMWYFYLGAPRGVQDRTFATPGSSAGSSANYPGPAGIRALGALTLETYFMIGKGIPDLPPPHPKIEAILARAAGDAEQDRLDEKISVLPVPNNPATMEAGDGFAHGLNFELNSDFNFILFYASMNMVMGYNINFRQYPGRSCRIISGSPGSEISSERPLGINGWYAKGDAYAGIEGEMGIGVNFDFFQAKIPIINLGCAISMYAEFPSPEYFKGRAGLYYDILNGAVTGRCNFVFEVGSKCYDPNYTPLDGLKFITDLKPEGNQTSVFARSEAAFAFAMDRVLPLKDDQYRGEGELIRYFRPQFKRFLITKVSDGSIVEFRPHTITDNGFRAESRTLSALNENTDYVIRAEVIVFERIGGSWVQVRKRDGSEFVDYMVKNFTTGPHPTTFEPENLLITYPIQKQRNYMVGEKGEKGNNLYGFVLLDSYDPILLEPSGRRRLADRPTSGNVNATLDQNITTVSYQIHIQSAQTMDPPIIIEAIRNDARTLRWVMPDNLPLNRRYSLKVFKLVTTRDNPILGGERTTFQTVRRSFQVADIAASTANIRQSRLLNDNIADNAQNTELLNYYFRSSQFATLSDKVNANSYVSATRGLFGIDIRFRLVEPFDEFDRNGYFSPASRQLELPPLVSLKEDYNNFMFNNLKSRVYTYGKDLKSTRWSHAFRPADYASSMYSIFINDIRTTRNRFWVFPERNAVDVTYNAIDSWVDEPLPQMITLGTVASPLSGSELTSISDGGSGTVYTLSGMSPGIAVSASTPTFSVFNSNEWVWTANSREVKNISQSIVSRMNRVIAGSRVNESRTLVSLNDLFTVTTGPRTMNFTSLNNAIISPSIYTYLPSVNYNIDWHYNRPADRVIKRISTSWRL